MEWKRGLIEAMSDDGFVDFTLVGTDNVEVPCTKVFLAAQSPVFRSMFYGGFHEQECERSSLNYHSSIIRVLINYCHSGDVDLTLILNKGGLSKNEISRLLELRDAGRYFQLAKVVICAEKRLGDAVFRKADRAGYVCSGVLTELMAAGEDSGNFWDVFFQYALKKPMECFVTGRSTTCSSNPSLLLKVLENVDDTFCVVKCLEAWSFLNNTEDTKSGSEARQALIDISSRLDLKKLSILQLSKVKPCSLFPMERIHKAFVYNGSLHHIQEKCLSPPRVIYVTGAGVKGLDGFYAFKGATSSQKACYWKNGKYGGVPCRYLIRGENLKCLISVRIMNSEGFFNTFKLLDLYQAHRASRNDVPFNDWECLEGADPAPMVAKIGKVETSSTPFSTSRLLENASMDSVQHPAPFNLGLSRPDSSFASRNQSTVHPSRGFVFGAAAPSAAAAPNVPTVHSFDGFQLPDEPIIEGGVTFHIGRG